MANFESQKRETEEKLSGIVERVTYHNEINGWSVIKVTAYRQPGKLVTVVLHQIKVFAGASMDFFGHWTQHPVHGEQFKSTKAIEKKPSSVAALEKYLGSGLIKGVGPETAKKIVKHFKENTLDVFENRIGDLMRVPGIAEKKLQMIEASWGEHKTIRDVMIFLQSYGISTLFAVKIFKAYGPSAITKVSENPYNLAKDIYGIGFFSADKIALSMGFLPDGNLRVEAAVKHILNASREDGHCYLTLNQIEDRVSELLNLNIKEKILPILLGLIEKNEIKKRDIESYIAFYANTIYFAEIAVAKKVRELLSEKIKVDNLRVENWVNKYCLKHQINLSQEQFNSITQIVGTPLSILTGGPGCGKTTSTKVLVQLLLAMNLKVIMTAPTGRAAQRMSEVVGLPAKTIHRLLEFDPSKNGFKKNENEPLEGDFLIVDESSMLDIVLTSSLFKAIPQKMRVLFIGDPDQLPAVGPGNVLHDLMASEKISVFKLTQIFRQAAGSAIIQNAHAINRGETPQICSPLQNPNFMSEKIDCLFLDSEEATQAEARFIAKVAPFIRQEFFENKSGENRSSELNDDQDGDLPFVLPKKFLHVDLNKLASAQDVIEELKIVLKKVHPWSTLHYGLTATEGLLRLYTHTIPKALGPGAEIQILSPQIRGTMGTHNLNLKIQQKINPPADNKKEIVLGEKIFRIGDRVIQTRNNYDLGVFNGDIGEICEIDLSEFKTTVFYKSTKERIDYSKEDLADLQLAYAITIHKSQGSEFQAVIIPVFSQHFKMLFRNLLYTGLTRGKKLVVFIGSRKALKLGISSLEHKERQTTLKALIGDINNYSNLE